MSTEITIDQLCDGGLYLSKFSKKDIVPVSSTKVGIPYLVISESNVPIYSVVIKPTDKFKSLMHMEYANYFVINSLGETKYISHIASGTSLVEIHKTKYLDKYLSNQINLVCNKAYVGLLSSKYPLVIANKDLELNRVYTGLKLEKDSSISVNLLLRTDDNKTENLINVNTINNIEPEDVIDAKYLREREVLKQTQFLESLTNSDVPHFAQEEFMNLVYKVVPDKLFRLGAYQPHSLVWYLTKTLGKTIVQNMYNNRDFKTEDLNNLLVDENRTLENLYKEVSYA